MNNKLKRKLIIGAGSVALAAVPAVTASCSITFSDEDIGEAEQFLEDTYNMFYQSISLSSMQALFYKDQERPITSEKALKSVVEVKDVTLKEIKEITYDNGHDDDFGWFVVEIAYLDNDRFTSSTYPGYFSFLVKMNLDTKEFSYPNYEHNYQKALTIPNFPSPTFENNAIVNTEIQNYLYNAETQSNANLVDILTRYYNPTSIPTGEGPIADVNPLVIENTEFMYLYNDDDDRYDGLIYNNLKIAYKKADGTEAIPLNFFTVYNKRSGTLTFPELIG